MRTTNERTCPRCSRSFVGADVLCRDCRAAWDHARAVAAAVRREQDERTCTNCGKHFVGTDVLCGPCRDATFGNRSAA